MPAQPPRKLNRRQFAKLSAAGLLATRTSLLLAKTSVPTNAAAAVQAVNPIIGASTSQKLGEGKTFPGATTPFGMVQLSPDTLTGGDNAAGYSWEHTSIEGFSHTHMSGVGWYGDFGNLLIMPTTGPFKAACGRPDHMGPGPTGEGWRSRFKHSTETAEAGYYAITLDDYNIRAEMTATPYAGFLRFTYPEAETARIQIDLSRRIGGTSTKQFVRVADQHTIEGWILCTPEGGGWGDGAGHVGYTLYFRTEFSKPIQKHGVWTIEIPPDFFDHKQGLLVDRLSTDTFYELVAKAKVTNAITELEDPHLGFFVEFPTTAGEQVLVKSGISFVDIEGARKNLLHDIPEWDFDAAHREARKQWAEALNKITIEGATDTQESIFYTALFHAMVDPRKISDLDGRYTAADSTVRREDGFTYRTIFSGWDVFRAELPLMTIINPDIVNDQVATLVELAERSGKGYLERWEIMNAYSGCMDGDPATAVILDAYTKGIRKFDIHKAYAACRQTAGGSGDKTNRPSNDFYMAQGYVPDQISWTMDNAYYDWCVASLAQALNKPEDADLFRTRSANYKKIYDPTVKSMRARHQDGSWMEWKGAIEFGQGCVESNPLQQSWFVPHDVYGLIDLMGADQFSSTLEDLFEKTPDTFGWNPYYNHSNEPVHHIAYLFAYAGKPWLTQKWVRRIMDQAYHNQVDGIVGNDDVGQMSAWYVLSALGFYPVCPGDDIYILGSPIFAKATLELNPKWHKGRAFTITAKDVSKKNCYIQSARLNGKAITRCWISHQEITSGGILDFTMGPEPNQQWGSSPADLPPDAMRKTNSV